MRRAGNPLRAMGSSFSRFRRLEADDNVDDDDDDEEENGPPLAPHVMSEQEIMHKYWKLAVRLYIQYLYVIVKTSFSL